MVSMGANEIKYDNVITVLCYSADMSICKDAMHCVSAVCVRIPTPSVHYCTATPPLFGKAKGGEFTRVKSQDIIM